MARALRQRAASSQGAELMRIRTWRAVFFRAALAGLAAATLAACGAKEPATDAERLARGRDLVKQMSSKLASATVVSVDDDRTTRPGAWRQEGDRVAHGQLHRATARSVPHEDDGRPWARVLVQRQDADRRLTSAEGLRTGADARDDRPHARRARRAVRHGAANGRSVLQLPGESPAFRQRPRAATPAPRMSAIRPARTWPSRTSASSGSCGSRCRASRCRSGSR